MEGELKRWELLSTIRLNKLKTELVCPLTLLLGQKQLDDQGQRGNGDGQFSRYNVLNVAPKYPELAVSRRLSSIRQEGESEPHEDPVPHSLSLLLMHPHRELG
jgi:hypothetical protein